ncbi:hypothetical protein DIPPA_11926 [Diplonema papillatum]|nr:hypothetical protein DIPPA_11926 [Diplonema papillatum]
MRGTGVRLAAAHGGGGVGRVEYKRKKLSSLVTLAHRYNVSDDVKKQPWYIPTSAGDPETRREPPPPPLLPGEAANQEPSETGQQTEHERPSTTSHAAATFQQTLDALVLCRGPAPQRRRQRGASPPPSRSDQASVFPDDHRQTPQTEPTRGGEASGRVCSTHLRGEEGERRRSEAALLTTAGQVETADSSGASKQARTTMAPRARGEASERVRSTQLRGEESERKRTEAAQTAAGPPVETSDSPRAPQPAPRGRKPLSLPDRWYPELPEADGADDDDGGLPARGGRRCGPPGAAAGCPAATYTPTAARTFGSTLGTSRADGGALPQPQGAQCATAQHGTRHGAEEPAADASIRSTLQPGRVDGGVLPHPHGAHCAPARDGSEPAADAGTRSTPQTDRTRAAAHPSPLPAPATGRRGTPAWPPVSEPGHATAGPHRHQPRLDIPDPDTNFHRLKVGARDWEDNAFRKKSSISLPFESELAGGERGADGDQGTYREPATTNDTEVAHAARGAPLSSASYDPDGSWPASSVVATAPRRADGEGKPSRPTDEEDSELEANSDLEPPAKESRVPKGDEEHRLRTTDVSTRVVDVGEMDRPLSASYDPDGSWPASSVVATAQRLRTGGPSAADGEGRPIGEEDGGLEADRDLEPWAQESRASTGDEEHRLRTTDVSTRMVDVGEMNRLLNARGAPHPLTVFEKLTARGFVVSDAALARLIARVGKELLTWGTKPGNDDQAKRSALGKQVLSKLEDLSESHEAGPLSADALLLCCCCVPLPHTAGKVYARFVSEKVALSRGTLITYVKMLDAFDFGREAKTALLEAVRMGIDVPADLVQKITNPPNVHSARTMRGVAKKHKRAEPPQVLC